MKVAAKLDLSVILGIEVPDGATSEDIERQATDLGNKLIALIKTFEVKPEHVVAVDGMVVPWDKYLSMKEQAEALKGLMAALTGVGDNPTPEDLADVATAGGFEAYQVMENGELMPVGARTEPTLEDDRIVMPAPRAIH
jgi:hypothetical protein